MFFDKDRTCAKLYQKSDINALLFLQQILVQYSIHNKGKNTNSFTKTALFPMFMFLLNRDRDLTCDKKSHFFPFNLILLTTSQYERYGTILNFVKSMRISDLQFYLSKVPTKVSPLGRGPTV